MAERSFTEQLDERIEELLRHPDRPAVPGSPDGGDLAALASLAADLRDLPSPGFKGRLKEDLRRRFAMTAQEAGRTTVQLPTGFRTVTPYLIAGDCAGMIDFVKKAFGAEERFRTTGGAGGIHCEMKIGDSMLMMGGGGAYTGPVAPAALHLYVENPDEVYARALEAGATSAQGMMEDYGERFGAVKDAFGNEWYIARRLGARYVEPPLNDVNAYFHPAGSMRFVEFLEKAFGGERVEFHASPQGTVLHAKIRLGNSIVELGEAHGDWQPLTTAIYLFVPNVDETYGQALAAGATSLTEPADQPYGHRNAGVKDPFGHTWYIASPIEPARS